MLNKLEQYFVDRTAMTNCNLNLIELSVFKNAAVTSIVSKNRIAAGYITSVIDEIAIV